MIFMKQAITAAHVVTHCCSPTKPNSTAIAVGQPFLPRPSLKPLTASLTAATAWCAKKCVAALVMPIWAMSSPMAHRPQVSAIASIRWR